MTESTHTNVFGIPVQGEKPYKSRSQVKQHPVSELEPILKQVLEIPVLENVRWRQYTPYFNDGEPCEFGVSQFAFRTTETPDDAGDYEDGYLDSWSIKYNTETPHGLSESELAAVTELSAAVEGGWFEDALYDAFGDHVTVTVDKDKIELETYDHD